MNYKIVILIFLLGSSATSIHPFQFWNIVTPVTSFILGTFHYLKYVTDYFVPATQAELNQVKTEILSMIANNARSMETATLNNIDHLFETTKKELEEKINCNVNNVSLRLNHLIRCLENAKKDSSIKINESHSHFIHSAQTNIQVHNQKNKDMITTFLKNVMHHNNTIFKQSMLEHWLALKKELTDIKKKNKNIRKKTRTLLQKTSQENSETLQNHHQIIIGEIDEESKRLQPVLELYKEKMSQIQLKSDQIKNLHTQKMEEFFKRISAITMRYNGINKNKKGSYYQG
jgi:hypothetical protein